MKAKSERIDRGPSDSWVARSLRACVRAELQLVTSLIAAGVSPRFAKAVARFCRLLLITIAAVVAAPVLIVVAVCRVGLASKGIDMQEDEDEEPKWLERDPDDHREDLFYHPAFYNDDPDPRFHDPRHEGR